ncbi:MAG: helix-turn-helix domain-containing protein [bacterium]
MTYKDLTKLGLNEKEAKIYLASLELGETFIQRISKKSGVNRTSAYHVIARLKEKGLMRNIVKRKKTYYYAEDPRKIKEELNEKIKKMESILPELLSIATAIDKKPKVRFYEGDTGIEEIYKEILSYEGEECLVWASEVGHFAMYKDFFNEYFIPERIRRKIWIRMIMPGDEDGKKYKARETNEFRATRLINPTRFPIKSSVNIFGKNKISIVPFNEKIGLIIESEKIYMTIKSIFEMNWEALG